MDLKSKNNASSSSSGNSKSVSSGQSPSKISSTSQPISQSSGRHSAEATNTQNKHRKTVKLVLLMSAILVLLLFGLLYWQIIPQHWVSSLWSFKQVANKNASVVPSSSDQFNRLMSNNQQPNNLTNHQETKASQLSENSDGTAVNSSENIAKLQQQIRLLKQQIQQSVQTTTGNNVSASIKNSQFNELIELIKNHQQQQQTKMMQLDERVAKFTVLINRWKKTLADKDLLIDNIYNHLRLIQSQMVLNYSPQLLSQQLEEVDQLIAELDVEELAAVRLEIQTLARKLDFQPSVPVENWLRELYLLEQLIPSFIEQHLQERKEGDFFILEAPELQAMEDEKALNQDHSDKIQGSFLTTVKAYLNQRLSEVFSISKTPVVASQNNHPIVINSLLTGEQINHYLKDRLQLIRISILARNWDTLRQQSIDTNIWLTNHLPEAQSSTAKLLGEMSQYKPIYVEQTLARAITLVLAYRQAQLESNARSQAGQNIPPTSLPTNQINQVISTTPVSSTSSISTQNQ